MNFTFAIFRLVANNIVVNVIGNNYRIEINYCRLRWDN